MRRARRKWGVGEAGICSRTGQMVRVRISTYEMLVVFELVDLLHFAQVRNIPHDCSIVLWMCEWRSHFSCKKVRCLSKEVKIMLRRGPLPATHRCAEKEGGWAGGCPVVVGLDIQRLHRNNM